MSNTPFRPAGPTGLPYELEVIVLRRRWMMILFVVTLILSLAAWMMHSRELDSQVTMAILYAGAMGAAATWVLMVMLAQALHGWAVAIMAGAAGLFIPVMTVLGVIVLNYQASDRLSGGDEEA